MAEEKYTASIADAMERLGLNRAEVYHRVKDGALKAEKIDRRLHFTAAELERYAGVLAEERDAVAQELKRWLDTYADRLRQSGQSDLEEVDEKSVDEQIAELGHRLMVDGLSTGVQDLYLDPVDRGDRLIYGYGDRREEVGRFLPGLSDKLKTWIKKLAPLAGGDEVQIKEAVGQQVIEEETYQFRLTVVPTRGGEHIHLHFFRDYDGGGVDRLGYTTEQVDALRTLLSGRPGLLLIAGAGDLEAERHRLALAQELGAAGKLVVSLEHRVQYRSETLVQLDLGQPDGPGFEMLWQTAIGMRPDVVIVDDVRDQVQARALLEGVHSGAVVVAQVRATTGVAALKQLLSYEVNCEALARALTGLVERVSLRQLDPCGHAKRVLDQREAELLGVEVGKEVYTHHAGSGFVGRCTVYGLWQWDDKLATWICTVDEEPPTQAKDDKLALAWAVRQAVFEGKVLLEEAEPYL